MRIKLAALIVALFATVVAATTTQVAAQELPVGEFRVVPQSGPVGTVVMVSGDFDKDITQVTFRCTYFDIFEEGWADAHIPAEASPSFRFEYKIPPELSEVQGSGVKIATLIGACRFRAEAGHKLRAAWVPFTVTEAVVMPSTGLASRSNGVTAASTAVAILAAGGVALVLLGWRTKAERR